MIVQHVPVGGESTGNEGSFRNRCAGRAAIWSLFRHEFRFDLFDGEFIEKIVRHGSLVALLSAQANFAGLKKAKCEMREFVRSRKHECNLTPVPVIQRFVDAELGTFGQRFMPLLRWGRRG